MGERSSAVVSIFVVTQEGQLILGNEHMYMSGGESVQAAGTMRLYKGRITELTNNSGHYRPSIAEGENSLNVLNRSGASTSGAKVKLYEGDGTLQKSFKAQ